MLTRLSWRIGLFIAGVAAAVSPIFDLHASNSNQTHSSCVPSTLRTYLEDNEVSYLIGPKLKALLDQTESRYLSKSEEDAFQKIFLDPSLSPKERNRQAFEIVLNARLRLLNPTEAFRVRRVLEKKLSLEPHKNIEASHLSGNMNTGGEIVIGVAERYKDSILYYSVLLHEMEHAIQDVRTNILQAPDKVRFGKKGKTGVHAEFIIEAGAMQAEWHYSSLIPESIRQEMIEIIRQDKTFSSTTKRSFLGLLDGAPTPFAHVKNEWQMHRYSLEQLKKDRQKMLATKVGLYAYRPIMAGVVAGMWVSREVCGSDENATRTRSIELQKYCRFIRGFKLGD